jgi:hypothetical protein
VVRGSSLPPWGPADQLYVIGGCDGLYISNGEDYSTVPSEQYVRNTWMTVELGHGFRHTFGFRLNHSGSGGAQSLPLVTSGPSTVTVSVTPTTRPGLMQMRFSVDGQGPPLTGPLFTVKSGRDYQVVVVTDPVKHLATVTVDGLLRLARTLVGSGPITVNSSLARSVSAPPALSVVNKTDDSSQPTLCQSLISQSLNG